MTNPSAGNAPFSAGNVRASKLTASQVQEIRTLYDAGRASQGQLSREYGVSVVQVGRIVRREVWQHLPPPGPSQSEIDESAARMLVIAKEAAKKQAEEVLDDLAAGPETSEFSNRELARKKGYL